MGAIDLVEEELRFKFCYQGQFSLAYNKGKLDWGDFYLSRPNFSPVYSPSGRAVTTNCAYRYNHHKSIFLGHGRTNGINFFHDNNPTRDNLGDIALVEAESEVNEASISCAIMGPCCRISPWMVATNEHSPQQAAGYLTLSPFGT